MDENIVNRIVKNINDLTNEIEEDISNDNLTIETDNLYGSLLLTQKELYQANVNKNTKRKCNYRILKVKKELTSYYNQSHYILSKKNNTIRAVLNMPKNAQDNLAFNLNQFIGREHILVNENDDLVLDYLTEEAIPNLEKIIDLYNRGTKDITRESILMDINIIKDKLKQIKKRQKKNDFITVECEGKLSYLEILQETIKTKIKNDSYTPIKDKIYSFIQELNIYNTTTPDIDTILELEKTYLKIKNEIDSKYKLKDKQLYDNLIRYLYDASSIIDNIESKSKLFDAKTKEEILSIESVEDSKELYKKYDKQVLTSYGIASMALTDDTIGPVLTPAIIEANEVVADKHEVVNDINEILAKSINATKEDGAYIKPNKIKIDSKDIINSLLKAITLIKTKSKELTVALLNRVKDLSVVVKAKEHLRNIRQQIDNKKEEHEELKIIKLYYEYVLSNKAPEEFAKENNLNNEELNKLLEYINYRNNLDNKEEKHHGR